MKMHEKFIEVISGLLQQIQAVKEEIDARNCLAKIEAKKISSR